MSDLFFYICHVQSIKNLIYAISLLKCSKHPNSYHIVIMNQFRHICIGVKYIHNLKWDRIPTCWHSSLFCNYTHREKEQLAKHS